MSRIEKIKIEQAIGKTLIHDITLIDIKQKLKGPIFRKGHIIQEQDIEKFKQLGKEHVYTINLSAGEIHEDDAAIELAKSLMGKGTYRDEYPSEGKINIYACFKGLTKINREKLLQFNLLKIPSCPTLVSNKIVKKGQKIASVRIIGLYTLKKTIERARKIVEGGIISVKPFLKEKIGIIATGNEVFYKKIEDTFTPRLKERLMKTYDSKILYTSKAPDKKDLIKKEIERAVHIGCEVILITAGTSVDPDDVTFKVIREMSEDFSRGVPLQPGNYLSVGYIKDIVILGVPAGAVYSSKSSLDFILPRILTGEKMSKREIYELGYGGLL
ncbi:MAG: molybdopterin-binding protein [Deltaproteobacteria bacterium]|nr:molybdopterin-binding protein [Deltaproteobacteria bacterium]